jgi:cellulose synthase/poly-beta-1,6-N-acetylglucosamine synthase-like glycosyltransferase
VNDRSTDRTSEIIGSWSERFPEITSFVTTEESGRLIGKVNALTQGLDKAQGEIVIMTDADCIVPHNWAMEHVGWYDETVGMVSSMTSLIATHPLEYAHSLEMVEVLTMSMAGFNYNIPVSVIGNNLSVRKSAYDKIGGYRNIPFSVTEDVALFQAIWNADWKVKFKINTDIAVLTSPPDSFRTWWRQKNRWVQGGKDIGWFGALILAFGYVGIVILLGAPFLSSSWLIFTVIGAKCLADAILLVPTLHAIGRLRTIYYFPLYQVYLLFFLLCVPILYFQRNVKWKGRVYRQ